MSTPTAPTPPEGLPAVEPFAPAPPLPSVQPPAPAPAPPFSILPPPAPPFYTEAVTAPIQAPPHTAPKNRALALAFTALIVSLLALTASLVAWAVDHPVNPQGPQGPAGPVGPAGARGHNHVSLCIVQNPATGDVASITVPVHGACGPDAILIRVP